VGSCGDCGTSRPVSSCPAPEPDSGRAFSFPAVLVLAPVCERSEASSFSPDERGSEWDKSDVRGGRKGTGGDGEACGLRLSRPFLCPYLGFGWVPEPEPKQEPELR